MRGVAQRRLSCRVKLLFPLLSRNVAEINDADRMIDRTSSFSVWVRVWVCFECRCWSYVGDDGVGQNLSIGAGCDTKAVVQHEILHALGFYHEQSRSDRDDYVQIWWDEIEEGKFNSNLFALVILNQKAD